jgi:hypothetical protein
MINMNKQTRIRSNINLDRVIYPVPQATECHAFQFLFQLRIESSASQSESPEISHR